MRKKKNIRKKKKRKTRRRRIKGKRKTRKSRRSRKMIKKRKRRRRDLLICWNLIYKSVTVEQAGRQQSMPARGVGKVWGRGGVMVLWYGNNGEWETTSVSFKME